MRLSDLKQYSVVSTNPVTQAQPQQNQVSQTDVQQDTNLGTGFNPSFESQSTDSFMSSAMKTIGNAPKSLLTLGKDVVTAVVNPVNTAKAVGTLLKGVGGKVGETALEKTNLGQSILSKMNESRVSRGLAPLPTNEKGVIQAVRNTRN